MSFASASRSLEDTTPLQATGASRSGACTGRSMENPITIDEDTTTTTTANATTSNDMTTGKRKRKDDTTDKKAEENAKRKRSGLSVQERRAIKNAASKESIQKWNEKLLELALLLPVVSKVCNPSRLFIADAAIAYIHASDRYRHQASRELRLLKEESDALRKECNELCRKAGLPNVEEPMRSEDFKTVLAGELVTIDGEANGGSMDVEEGSSRQPDDSVPQQRKINGSGGHGDAVQALRPVPPTVANIPQQQLVTGPTVSNVSLPPPAHVDGGHRDRALLSMHSQSTAPQSHDPASTPFLNHPQQPSHLSERLSGSMVGGTNLVPTAQVEGNINRLFGPVEPDGLPPNEAAFLSIINAVLSATANGEAPSLH